LAELTNRAAVEANIARVLARLGAKQRKEMEKRLGNPPDIRKLTDGWWKDKEREIQDAALVLLLLPFEQSAIQHGLDSAAAKESALTFAEKRANELATGFTKNSRDIMRTAATSWTPNETIPVSQLRDTTLQVFGPKRMSNVAVTETTTAQHQGSEEAIKATVGLSEDDTWFTEEDSAVCPTCRPLHGSKRSRWHRFFPVGPPAHVNCRCWISYRPQPSGE